MEALRQGARRSSRLLQRAAAATPAPAPAVGLTRALQQHRDGAENSSPDAAAADGSKRRRRRAVTASSPASNKQQPQADAAAADLQEPLASITNQPRAQQQDAGTAAGAVGPAPHSPPAKRPRGRPPRAPTAAAAAAAVGAKEEASTRQQAPSTTTKPKASSSSTSSSAKSKSAAGSTAGPTRAAEQHLWSQGYQAVAGVDEAGRGPLAGPVVAAAAVLPPDAEFALLNDSKQMTEEEREAVYEQLTSHPGVSYAVAVVDAGTIDQINILQAAMLAMRTAVEGLAGKGLQADHLLIDGNRKPSGMDGTPAQLVVKGDASVTCIAAASVLAKVTRDRMMLELDQEYPQYGFAQHKGYGVPAHKAALQQHGPCPQHRRSFQPVKSMTAWPGYPKPPPADAAGTVVAAVVAAAAARGGGGAV